MAKEKSLLDKFKLPTDVATMPINRLSMMSDFIFASAIVIMVFTLDFPEKGTISNFEDLTNYYLKRGGDSGIINFLISFAIVATYWFKHLERFNYYKSTDSNHLYFETFFLAFLLLVPIANNLNVDFPNIFSIQAFYSLMMFFMGLLAHLGWRYACHNHRLVDKGLDDKTILSVQHETLVEPIVAVLAILIAYIYPLFWEVTLMIIPVFFIIQKRITRKAIRLAESSE